MSLLTIVEKHGLTPYIEKLGGCFHSLQTTQTIGDFYSILYESVQLIHVIRRSVKNQRPSQIGTEVPQSILLSILEFLPKSYGVLLARSVCVTWNRHLIYGNKFEITNILCVKNVQFAAIPIATKSPYIFLGYESDVQVWKLSQNGLALQGMWPTDDGNLYMNQLDHMMVVNNGLCTVDRRGLVRMRSTTNTILHRWLIPGGCRGAAFNKDLLFFSDAHNIFVLSPKGVIINRWAVPRNWGVNRFAFHDSKLYVTHSGEHLIRIYSIDSGTMGVLLQEWVRESKEYVWGIAIHDDLVYMVVTQDDNARIETLDLNGKLVSKQEIQGKNNLREILILGNSFVVTDINLSEVIILQKKIK